MRDAQYPACFREGSFFFFFFLHVVRTVREKHHVFKDHEGNGHKQLLKIFLNITH